MVDELHSLLDDSVRLRLRADVPVATYLSGGLDSSLLAALAARQSRREQLSAFGVGFANAHFDESAQQDEIARHLDVGFHRTNVDAPAIADVFPRVIELAEQPLLRTAPAPLLRLSGSVRASGLKVVLTGEGADELFGGYDIFREDKIRRFWAREPESTLRPRLFGRVNRWLATDPSHSGALLDSFYRRGLLDVGDPLYSHRLRFANTARLLRLLHPGLVGAAGEQPGPLERLTSLLPSRFASFSPLSRAQYLEVATLLEPYLLHAQGDRMLMGSSIEGRFPYLDHRVAAFAAGLPDRLRLRGLEEKYVLRRAAARELPRAIHALPKRPYRAPIRDVFGDAQAPAYVQELLGPRRLLEAGLLDPTAVARLRQKLGSSNGRGVSETDEMALVGALSLMLLHDRFVEHPRLAPSGRADARRGRGARGRPPALARPGRVMGWIPPQLLVHDSLSAAAEALPAKTAIADGSVELTYGELYEGARRFARILQESGLERGDRVALYLDNTATCATAIFGTLLAGGVFVVVNPQTKAEKLAFVLSDSEASVLVAEERLEATAACGPEPRAVREARARSEAPGRARGCRAGGRGSRDDPQRPGGARLHLRDDGCPEGGDDEPPGARLQRREHRPVPSARRRGPDPEHPPLRLHLRLEPAAPDRPARRDPCRSSARSCFR